MKRRDFYLAGAAVALASAASLVTYAIQKSTKEKAGIGYLIAGLAGLAVSGAIAATPTIQATRNLTVENLLDEEDTGLMQENISEILGNAADRGNEGKSFQPIEVDEDATIEDFITE